MYLICLVLSGFAKGTYAAYFPGTKCPEAPDKSLDSICGVVKSSKPTPVLKNGVVTYEAPRGVEGVSVYVYECDNQSPSCKKSGDLVYPFSSTSTNKDGMFYLWARKLDNYSETPSGANPNTVIFMSKRRYLVFACGKTLAGMQEIPSFLDLTYVVQEVNCPPMQAYATPDNKMSIIPNENSGLNVSLASQMGTDDMQKECNNYADKTDAWYKEWCDITSGSYINHLTMQLSFKTQQSATAPTGLAPLSPYTPVVSMNEDLHLSNADPRYMHGAGEGFMVLANAATGGNMKLFQKGAFWSRDCFIRYPDAEDNKFCIPIGTADTEQSRAQDYANNKLYIDSEFLVQNKLPNIPPLNSLKFYKEFPARQDITEYVQDPTDPAKFLSLQFANCIGSVFLRKDNQTTKDMYVSCSKLQKCNEKISGQNSYLNVQTTGGPARNLANPTTFREEYLANVSLSQLDLNARVCKINPYDDAEIPVTVAEIQPPWDPDPSKYKLDSTYWSAELIYYFGKNNVATKYGLAFQSLNDSFGVTGGTAVNVKTFVTGEEAASQPVKGGTWAMITGGGKRPNNTMAGAVAISSNQITKDTKNALTSLLSPPTKDGVYELKILSGILIPTLGSKTMKIGEYSKVNTEPEKIVIAPVDDRTIIRNTMFSGDLDHHPAIDQGLDNGNFNGTRTPTSAIYLTNPAINRIEALHAGSMLKTATANDLFDSFLSILYGKGTVDFTYNWSNLTSFIGLWWQNLFTNGQSKSFFDRKFSQATLPLAGAEPRNDLQTQFPIAEENFTKIFTLPVSTNLATNQWGPDNTCYPWHQLPDQVRCDTDKTESPDGISRTCRVDSCSSGTISCECQRDIDEIGVVTYTKICQNPAYNNEDNCSQADRLICAQNQMTCTSGACIAKYKDVKYGNDNTACDASRFVNVPPKPRPSFDVVRYTLTTEGAPSCVMSVAGPYECGGELRKDSELVTKTAWLPDNPNTIVPPQNADSLAVANNELRKSWQNPFAAKLTYAPAAFASGLSSITDTAPANDISKRKDSVAPGGDTQNGAVTRSTFAAPLLVKEPVYNKINLHCGIDDKTDNVTLVSNLQSASQMGSFMPGNWSCIVNDPPTPEIVDLDEYLKTYTLQPACNFNPSDACRNAIFSLVVPGGKSGSEDQLNSIKFSTTFINIMNIIATRVNMPASVLMSVISGEGTSSKYGYYFTPEGEQELKDASLPWYGSFPGCDEMNAASVGPYDLIRVWFNTALNADLSGITDQGDTGKVSDLLDELAMGRHKTASRCNFLDSTFVAAAMLRSGRNGYISSCDKWTWEDAAQALRRFTWGWDESAKPDGNVMYSPGSDDVRNSKSIFEACRSY